MKYLTQFQFYDYNLYYNIRHVYQKQSPYFFCFKCFDSRYEGPHTK